MCLLLIFFKVKLCGRGYSESTGSFKQWIITNEKSHFNCVIIAYCLLPLTCWCKHFSAYLVSFSLSLSLSYTQTAAGYYGQTGTSTLSVHFTEMYTHPIPVSVVHTETLVRLVWVTECSCTWDFLSPTLLWRRWVLLQSSLWHRDVCSNFKLQRLPHSYCICTFSCPHKKNLLSVICISVAHDTFQDFC